MELLQNPLSIRKNNNTYSEIGSEFWDVPTINRRNSLFPESTQWYLSGRSALIAIIAELGKARSVSFPSWCCESMIRPFVDANFSIDYYPVVLENGELVRKVRTDSDVLFLMDYFGFSTPIPDLRGFDGVVIRDVTHSLFSTTYSDADYYFGSLRKWCGVWTGGYAWTKDGHKLEIGSKSGQEYESLRKRAMEEKSEYIKGKRTDKGYRMVFDAAEEVLENVGIAPAANRDVELAHGLDVDEIKKRRRANAEVFQSVFPEWLIFQKNAPTDTPMFVPVLVPDGKRDALWRYLILHDMYCPIHWPVGEYHRLDERTAFIYQNELSLVCDQRYTEEDMNRMVDTIKAFWQEA